MFWPSLRTRLVGAKHTTPSLRCASGHWRTRRLVVINRYSNLSSTSERPLPKLSITLLVVLRLLTTMRDGVWRRVSSILPTGSETNKLKSNSGGCCFEGSRKHVRPVTMEINFGLVQRHPTPEELLSRASNPHLAASV